MKENWVFRTPKERPGCVPLGTTEVGLGSRKYQVLGTAGVGPLEAHPP